jgi:NAD(P)-dependent dehydrogenase (short-subunit alcohol dehydrogenase family)
VGRRQPTTFETQTTQQRVGLDDGFECVVHGTAGHRFSRRSAMLEQGVGADLANRDGCVNTIATLIGELQRAGKTPDEFRKVVEVNLIGCFLVSRVCAAQAFARRADAHLCAHAHMQAGDELAR